MTERSWCPSLSPQPGAAAISEVKTAGVFAPLERVGGDAVSAKRDASVAANNSVSATEVAVALTAAFQRRFHKFDAALVSSKVNRSLWPRVPRDADGAGGSDGALVSPGTAVCLGVSTIGQTPISSPSIALPSDAVGDLVALLARRAAEHPETAVGDSVKGLVAFPPSETVTSLSEIVTSVASSKSMVEELRSLTVAGASAAKSDNALARLVTVAKKLESLTVATSDVTNTVVPMLDAVKTSEIRHLSLTGSQLGFGSGDLDREGLTSSFCDVAKVSKFLTSLDVADANMDTEFIVALLGAFAESDTKLLPEELGEDPEEVTRWTLEGRVSTALFLGRRKGAGEAQDGEPDSEAEGAEEEEDGDDDGDADEEAEEAEAEEEEEDGDAEAAEEGEEGSADDGEADGDEEDEEDEEAEALKKRKAERQRLLREKQERQEKLKRIKKELKLLVRAEAQERVKLLQAYCQAAEEVVAVNNGPIVNRRAEERQKKKEEYCTRRSGWSHLESLVLHGNSVGDRGCKQLARVLREEVPLTEDEVTQRKETADATRDGFGEELGASRTAVLHAEQKAWRALLRMARRECPAPPAAPRDTSVPAAVSDLDEEDEYAKEAPPVLLTNVERSSRGNRDDELTDGATDDGDEAASDGEADGGEAAADELSPEEQKQWQDWVAQSLPQIPVAPVKKGMGTVRFVDVGSCGIGRKGLRALATVLKTNKALETLRLRHNPLGSAVIAKKGAPQEEASALSSEFAEFAAMLSVNGGLRHLDLSYCRLTTGDVRAIAEALQQNTSLVTLALEGNQLGVDEPYQQQRQAHSYLYELWMAAARPGSAVRCLSLDHNEIAACLWPEEVAALAAVCGQLSVLSLSHVGLRQRHLQAWSAALPAADAAHCSTVRTLCLSRNEFVCEADGAALGELLQRFGALETLSLEEHPLLGSAGVAAALEHVPATLRHLDCSATGLTTPVVGAAQNPVLPPAAVAQLTHLLLSDVEAPTVAAVGEWVDFIKTCTPHRLRCLSLWSRGMAGKEGQLVPLLFDLAQACPSLTYVDGGFQPQLYAASAASAGFLELERLLLPRRMQSAAESHTAW